MVNSSAYLEDCVITKNNKNGFAICDFALSSSSRLHLSHCDVRGNLGGSFVEEKTVLLTEHGNSFSLNSGLNLNSEKGNEEVRDADGNNDNNYNDRKEIAGSIQQINNKNNNVGDSDKCTPNDQCSNINNSDNNHSNDNMSNKNESITNDENSNNNNNGNNNNNNYNNSNYNNNGNVNDMNAGVHILKTILDTDISSKNTEQFSSSLSASQEHSSSNTVIQERTFFLRKCIGDEDAMKFFRKFEWFDHFNDVEVEVEVEDDRESPQLVINLVPSNSHKESVKEKIVRNSTNLPRISSLTNINNTGNSKRKRVDESDSNFKENFDKLFGDYEKDFFEGIEVSDKKDEYVRCSDVGEDSDVMRVIKKEKCEGGKDEIHHNDITMKIEKI